MEEPKKTLTFLQRWKEDPAQIVGGALGMTLFLSGALTFLYGVAWGLKYGASGDQVFYAVMFGLCAFAATIFPFMLLQNHFVNATIRDDNERVAKRAAKERAEAEREAQKDAALLRVVRLVVLEWAVQHGQVDNVEGLAENLLVSLKAHKEEVRANRRPATTALLQPNSSLPG